MAHLLGQSLLDLRSTVVGKSEVATFGNSNANATVRFYDADDPEGHAYVMGLSNNTFTVKKRDDGDTVFAVGTTNPTITKGFEVIGDINYTGNLLQNGETYISSQWTTCNVVDSNVIIYGGAGTPSSVGIGTTNPLAPLHVEGNIYMTGVILQNGEEFVGGAGSINNLSTGSNFSYVPIYQPLSSGTKIITTNEGTAADRTLYTIPLSVGRYLISANIPFRNLDGLTLMDNQNWATLSLCRTPVNEAEPAISFQSIRINSDTELMMQPVTFIAEVNKRGLTYDVVVSGKGHRLEFGSTLHDARMRIVPIVPAAGLPDSTSVAAALQVSPAKLVERVTAASQSTFVVTQEGHFTASTSNVHVYLNGTKYVYVDATNKDYEFTLSYSYDPFPKIMNSIYTVTLEEPAVAGDIIDITVYPVATADTLYAAGYLFQNIEPNVSPGWNALMAGDGIRTPGTVIIDGNLIVQGQIIGGSNVAGFTTGTRYDVTNLTGVGAGLAVEWAESYPAPTLKPPTGGLWSPTSNVAWQRYAGNEVVINFNLLGTVAVAATSPSDVWSLSLPYHINPAIYANGALIGDWVISITAASVTSTYKGFGRVDTSMVDAIRIRYLQGTTEVGLVNIASGTTVAISGNVVYSTISMTGGVPVSFVPPEFRQEENGRLGINVGAGMPRAQLDIISSSDATALIVDAQDTGNSFEARVAGVPKMVIDSGGNVGFGTTDPRRQFHIEGDMLLTGRIVDSNMRDLWIPGSTLEWQATLSPPLFTLPSGGSLTYTLQQGRYRYIGNEVVYNVNMAGTVISRPTSTSADFKLNIPYALSLANYPVATIIGELWLTVTTADGLSTNAFKAFAKSITNDANNAHIRFLSGTTEGSLSTMAAGTTFSLQGQLIYNSQLIANVNGIPPSYIPAPIVQDQVGRVGINMGNNSPTSALYVRGSTSAEPAIIVNQVASTGDILKFQKLGVDRLVISNAGNVGIGTTEPLQKLHVIGNTRIQGDAVVTGNWEVQGTTTYMNTYTSVTSNVNINNVSGNGPALRVTQTGVGANYPIADFYDNDVSTTVPALRIADGGNVGIGTTQPQEKLHVNGTAQATLFSGSGASLTTLNVDNVSMGTLAVARGGTGNATYAIGDIVYASGATTLTRLADVVTGNALISGGVGVAPAWGKVGLTTHVSGTLGVANGGTGAVTLTTGKVLVGNGTGVVTQPTNLHWDDTNSRLGIGTSVPLSKLDIASAPNQNYISMSINNHYRFRLTADDGNALIIDANGDQEYRASFGANDGTGKVIIKTAGFGTGSTERMRVDWNGNVGIGTTAPLAKLDVIGSINCGPASEQRFTPIANFYTDITRNIYYDNGWKSLRGGSGSYIVMGGGSSYESLISFQVFDAPTTTTANTIMTAIEAMRIIKNGNVGINTTIPSQKLDVNGNVKATTFIGALQGNASSSTVLATSRNINNVAFNGSADITVNGTFYNVNDGWLRRLNDGANVQLFGNSRQMVFRTDGTTEYIGSIGGYPFVWMYGGDASGNRKMFLNTSGQLWCENYGWLHDKFYASGASPSFGTIYFANNGSGLNWGSSYSRIYDDGDLRITTDDSLWITAPSKVSISGPTYFSTAIYLNNRIIERRNWYDQQLTFSNSWYFSADLYLNSGGWTGGTTYPMAFRTDTGNYILCQGYFTFSDARIKTDVQSLDISHMMDVISQIRLVKYKGVDPTVANNEVYDVGVIGQEVAAVFEDAIIKSPDYIYDYNDDAYMTNGLLETVKPFYLEVGEYIKIWEKKESLDHIDHSSEHSSDHIDYEVLEVIQPGERYRVKCTHNDDHCELHFKTRTKVYLQGRRVQDFHTVNYDKIFLYSVGSCQYLKNENNSLKTSIVGLQNEVDDLKKRIEALERHILSS